MYISMNYAASSHSLHCPFVIVHINMNYAASSHSLHSPFVIVHQVFLLVLYHTHSSYYVCCCIDNVHDPGYARGVIKAVLLSAIYDLKVLGFCLHRTFHAVPLF